MKNFKSQIDTINLNSSGGNRSIAISSIIPLSKVRIEDIEVVGGKAAHLGELIRYGVNVPNGYVVSSSVYSNYQRTGAIDPYILAKIEEVRVDLGGNVAIRSSANCEDNDATSLTGLFDTFYVKAETISLKENIERLYSQPYDDKTVASLNTYNIHPDDVKMGLIVQELIAGQISGVMYTGINNTDQILIQYVSGFGNKLVDGEENGSAVLVDPKTTTIIQSLNYDSLPIEETALLELINSAQKILSIPRFNLTNLDIEFSIYDSRVYILQARILTRVINGVELIETPEMTLANAKILITKIAETESTKFGIEFSAFTNSNHIELLPQPKEMDIGIFQYIFSGRPQNPGAIQIGRKEMGYIIDEQAYPVTYFIGGKPYLSIARDAACYYFGIPETRDQYNQIYLRSYLDQIYKDPSLGAYPQMGLYMQEPNKHNLNKLFGKKADAYWDLYQNFEYSLAARASTFEDNYKHKLEPEMLKFVDDSTKRMEEANEINEITNLIFEVLENLRLKSCCYFVEGARLGFYYTQKLKDKLESILPKSTEIDIIYSKLLQGLDKSMFTEVNLLIAESASLDEAITLARDHINHYSTGELLEIRHTRFSEDEAALKQYVKHLFVSDFKQKFNTQRLERQSTLEEILKLCDSRQKIELEHSVLNAQKFLALRETIKFQFSKEYAIIRLGLLKLQKKLGLLEGSIFNYYPDELKSLIINPSKLLHLYKAREQAYKNYPFLDLPFVLFSNKLNEIQMTNNIVQDKTELQGVFLSNGPDIIDAIVYNLDNESNLQNALIELETFRASNSKVILVAKQLSIGHDALLALADGIILENAGIVSHGAQRARELGKPGVGGILTRYLRTGMKINLITSNKTVKLIN